MRPVRLTLQAFGPFAGSEVIDFRAAVDAGLFGIYGQTGAGKSTIFSAIAFALFGEAAKAEQDPSSLRSDHAAPDLPTEVEFVFDLGNERYVARRRPEQLRPKQRGAGETKNSHEAWLFDATGLPLESITRESSGKVVAEKKVGDVNEAISNLLGYGEVQFRQIVLLPQGKFETFLAAKTDVRLSILRELFDVSLYQRLATKLKESALSAERTVRAGRTVISDRLKSEGFDSDEALAEGAKQLEEEHVLSKQQESEAVQASKSAQGKLTLARQIEERFFEAEKAHEELLALHEREEEIKSLNELVSQAKRAKTLQDVERHLGEAKKELEQTAIAKVQTQRKAADAIIAAEMAAQAYQSEVDRSEEVNNLRKELQSYEGYQNSLECIRGLANEIYKAKLSFSQVKNAYDDEKSQRDRLLEQRQEQEETVKIARRADDRRQGLQQSLLATEARARAAEEFEKAKLEFETSCAEKIKWEAEHDEAAKRLADADLAFSAAEEQLSEVQALHLSAKLVPGQACPVCGSTEHPTPASGLIESAGHDAAFREAKRHLEEARSSEIAAAKKLASANATFEERKKRLAEHERVESSSLSLRAEALTLKSEIEKLGQVSNVQQAEAAFEVISQKASEAGAGLENIRERLDEVRREQAEASARFDQAISVVPEALRKDGALEAKITEISGALNARTVALKLAEDAAKSTREAALILKKDAEAAEKEADKAQSRNDESRKIFERRLLESNLSECRYFELKSVIISIDESELVIANYRRDVEFARERAAKALIATEGQERQDLELLERRVSAAELIQKEATNCRAMLEARLNQLQKLQLELLAESNRLNSVESETASLRSLAALFNADNPQKIDLETFAIGAMFDQVLSAANRRLSPMTVGRYALERETEGSGNSRRGLGIRIFDQHTGKSRATATLSGGEMFIAALSLALGLSDIVESVSGKVRLDTIFIDEGFGSLDTENESGTLDLVLQVMTNLVSQSRSVGLISHVSLVQEAIPNGFYVRKGVVGSSIEARGVV